MKSIMRLAIICFLLSGIQLPATESLDASRVQKQLVIDGKLNDMDWQQFTVLKTTSTSMPPTRAAVLYDNNNLYVGIICATTNRAPVNDRKNEGDIFDDDHVEIMIDPCTGGNEYLQVAVNAAGSRFDAWRSDRGAKYDATWDGNWQAVAAVGDGEWSCELKIPFVLLGVKEGANAPWKINIGRHIPDSRSYSSLAGGDTFNVPDKFAVLGGLTNIQAVSPKPLFRVLAPVAEINLRDGKMCCLVRAGVTNTSAVAGKVVVRLEEEGENNKRILQATEKADFLGSEGKEFALDSSVELVPVEWSWSLFRPGKKMKVVVSGEDGTQAFNEQSVSQFIIPAIQAAVIDQTKPELKFKTGFSRDGKGNKNGKVLITLENDDNGNKLFASREYPLTDEFIAVDFQSDKIPAGNLIARVSVKNAEGKSVCTKEVAFTHLSKEPERLNNLVCRLEKGELKLGKSEIKEIVFENPRAGWVWVKLGVALDGEGTVTVGESGVEWLKISADGENETMRWLQDGTHRLSVSGTVKSKVGYEVRSVPELNFSAYNVSPNDRNKTILFGPYDEKYLRNNGFLKNLNSMMMPNRKKDIEGVFAGEWVGNGGQWFGTVKPPFFKEANDLTPEYVFKCWSEKAWLTNDFISGYFIDEFISANEPADKRMAWLGGIHLMRSDKRFKNKKVYPYLTYKASGVSDYIGFMVGLCDLGTYPCFEWYPGELPTEEEMSQSIDKFIKNAMADYEQKIPGLLKRSIFVLGFYSMPGNYSCDLYPNVDYKVLLDLQLNMLANDPLFKDFAGIQWYTSGNTDDEIMRWCFELFRHYGIDGRRDKLSDKYGFRYELKHILNADFMQGMDGWETRSGTDGTLAVKEVKGYAKVIHPRKGQAVLDHVLWMKRTAKGPNMAAQVIKGLETGKLYSLRMLSGDYKELMAGKSTATNHALGVNLENVEILPNESFVGIVKASHWVDAYGFGENNPYCLNYYCKVFRAKGKTARLVISDWMDERNAGGPEGQELMCNFIQIQPFFSQGNMAPKSE